MAKKIKAEVMLSASSYVDKLAEYTFVTETVVPLRTGERYAMTLEPVEPELKPCPFCGGKPEYQERGMSGYFCCDTCSSSTPVMFGKDAAITAWNRRVRIG